MFMTAGSCSVMLLWPTRRTFCCQGCVAGSSGARRGVGGGGAGGEWGEVGFQFARGGQCLFSGEGIESAGDWEGGGSGLEEGAAIEHWGSSVAHPVYGRGE